MAITARKKHKQVQPAATVIPPALAARIRRDLRGTLAGESSPWKLNEFVSVDRDSGWREQVFEVRIAAPLEKRNSIWDLLSHYMDCLTGELSAEEAAHLLDVAIWVRDYDASSLV